MPSLGLLQAQHWKLSGAVACRGTRATAVDAPKPVGNTVAEEDLEHLRRLEDDLEDLTERGVPPPPLSSRRGNRKHLQRLSQCLVFSQGNPLKSR